MSSKALRAGPTSWLLVLVFLALPAAQAAGQSYVYFQPVLASEGASTASAAVSSLPPPDGPVSVEMSAFGFAAPDASGVSREYVYVRLGLTNGGSSTFTVDPSAASLTDDQGRRVVGAALYVDQTPLASVTLGPGGREDVVLGFVVPPGADFASLASLVLEWSYRYDGQTQTAVLGLLKTDAPAAEADAQDAEPQVVPAAGYTAAAFAGTAYTADVRPVTAVTYVTQPVVVTPVVTYLDSPYWYSGWPCSVYSTSVWWDWYPAYYRYPYWWWGRPRPTSSWWWRSFGHHHDDYFIGVSFRFGDWYRPPVYYYPPPRPRPRPRPPTVVVMGDGPRALERPAGLGGGAVVLGGARHGPASVVDGPRAPGGVSRDPRRDVLAARADRADEPLARLTPPGADRPDLADRRDALRRSVLERTDARRGPGRNADGPGPAAPPNVIRPDTGPIVPSGRAVVPSGRAVIPEGPARRVVDREPADRAPADPGADRMEALRRTVLERFNWRRDTQASAPAAAPSAPVAAPVRAPQPDRMEQIRRAVTERLQSRRDAAAEAPPARTSAPVRVERTPVQPSAPVRVERTPAGPSAPVRIERTPAGPSAPLSIGPAPVERSAPARREVIVPMAPQVREAPRAPVVREVPRAPVVREAPKAPVVREAPRAPVVREAPRAPVVRQAPQAPVVREAPRAPVVRQAPVVREAPRAPVVRQAPVVREAPRAPVVREAPRAPQVRQAPRPSERSAPARAPRGKAGRGGDS